MRRKRKRYRRIGTAHPSNTVEPPHSPEGDVSAEDVAVPFSRINVASQEAALAAGVAVSQHLDLVGLLSLIFYGAIGTIEQSIVAPFTGQLPLIGGFTLETPWSVHPQNYDLDLYREDPGFQIAAHLRGQQAIGPVRTHTTGILDYGAIRGWPGASQALETVHPGRSQEIGAVQGTAPSSTTS